MSKTWENYTAEEIEGLAERVAYLEAELAKVHDESGELIREMNDKIIKLSNVIHCAYVDGYRQGWRDLESGEWEHLDDSEVMQ